MYKENFPLRIKKARINAGYTQQQVSDRTGIKRASIAKYETGVAEPNLETLATLAQFYNISLNWLLGISIEQEPKGSDNMLAGLRTKKG